MFKNTLLIILVTTGCFILAACTGTVPGTQEASLEKTQVMTPVPDAEELGDEQAAAGLRVVITPAMKGNSATLDVGDILEVQIPTIPTEGFDWVIQDLDTTILLQEGLAVYTRATDPNSAGGTTTLRFTAVGVGNTTISLLYLSAASGDTPAMSKSSLSISVEVK